ncbi:MAG TPA: HlyD family secretion protein [Candidatus Acidoferrales bacterium]|nr:HlyD family secretion protein [Candidatus Acidoferrales bacterium]
MAQRTELDVSPNSPAENLPAPETHPAEPPPPVQASEFFRERPRARLYLIVAGVILLVGAFFAWRYFSSYESTDDAQVDGHLMPISARISGYVAKVNVDDNQYVEAGTVLFEIDPRDYQVAVDLARAEAANAQASARSENISVPVTSVTTTSQVSSTEADVANAQAGISAAQQQSDAAQAQLAQAQANDVKAQNDLERYKQLVAKQEVSQQAYDQAVAAARASTAGVAAAKASAAAAAQQVTQARSRLAQAQAAWDASQTGPNQVKAVRDRALAADAAARAKQASLEQAELNLQYTKIVAPASGLVTKNVEVGMNVQPGQQLASVVPLNDVWITANFKETQLKNMRPGQRAEIKADADGRTYAGRVDSIAGSSGARTSLLPPENATGNYVKVVQRVPVKIVLEPGQNADHSLRLGMSVEPKVFLK